MKYKSELINEIVENEGHYAPSLHYESECIDYWIESVRGAYPKLSDYEGEWLYYYLENDGIGKFPYLAINNITSTTVENAVPIPFKSAILKGNTKEITGKNIYTGIDEDGYITLSGFQSATGPKTTEWLPCEPNTTYVCNSPSRNRWMLKSSTGVETVVGGNTGNETPTVTTLSDTAYLRCYYKHDGYNDEITLQIEKGDISTDYEPYWKKLESVKMPVLTTTGKNLFNGELENGAIVSSTGANTPTTDNVRSVGYIKVKPNTSFVLSNDLNYSNNIIYEYDSNKNYIGRKTTNPFTTSTNCHYIRFRSDADQPNLDVKYQIEYGTQATSYEPYKSNILTVNEPVELRGIGDVKDELNLLTGELTQRIEEIVLDGSEGWESHADKTNTIVFKLTVNNLKYIDHHIISDRFPTNAPGDVEKITNTGNVVYAAILKSKADNLKNFKSYLSQNPITVQYQLATESIKTVDLSIIDESGNNVSKLKAMNGITHIQTSGTPLKPSFTGEIPVEAITQNLTSFVDLQMEE